MLQDLVRDAACFRLSHSLNLPGQIPERFTRIHGDTDSGIETPSRSQNTQSDVAALKEVLSFVSMTGVRGWQGMTATGTVTYQ